jgi:hypothetical protein
MNIFVVHQNPIIAAQMLCDKHIVKMCSESCQILSTVLHKLGHPAPMRSTHTNHPCTLWAGQTSSNFEWLIVHGLEICDEYTRRYGRTHATQHKLDVIALSQHRPKSGPLTPFVQCMKKYPELICDDPVKAYRAFYVVDKSRFAKWNKTRSAPKWYVDMLDR